MAQRLAQELLDQLAAAIEPNDIAAATMLEKTPSLGSADLLTPENEIALFHERLSNFSGQCKKLRLACRAIADARCRG